VWRRARLWPEWKCAKSIKNRLPSLLSSSTYPYDARKWSSTNGLWRVVPNHTRTVRALQKSEHATVYRPMSRDPYSRRPQVRLTALKKNNVRRTCIYICHVHKPRGVMTSNNMYLHFCFFEIFYLTLIRSHYLILSLLERKKLH
jgi:hypothetical protein